jgi:hypothetical protein
VVVIVVSPGVIGVITPVVVVVVIIALVVVVIVVVVLGVSGATVVEAGLPGGFLLERDLLL